MQHSNGEPAERPPPGLPAQDQDAASDRTMEGLLASVTAHGSDARGRVSITLDGMGRLHDVQLGADALTSSRGALETAIRQAHQTAFDSLQRERAERAADIERIAREQVDVIGDAYRDFAEQADRRLQAAIEAANRAVQRITG